MKRTYRNSIPHDATRRDGPSKAHVRSYGRPTNNRTIGGGRGRTVRFTLEPRATATPERFRLSIALVLKHPVCRFVGLSALALVPFHPTKPSLFFLFPPRWRTQRDATRLSHRRIVVPPRCHSRSVRSAWRFAVSDSRLLVRKHLQLHPVLVSPPTDASLFLCLSLRFVSRPVVYLLLAFLPSIRRILRIRVLLHIDVYVRVRILLLSTSENIIHLFLVRTKDEFSIKFCFLLSSFSLVIRQYGF